MPAKRLWIPQSTGNKSTLCPEDYSMLMITNIGNPGFELGIPQHQFAALNSILLK
jgi:hypothetical protein